MGYQQDFDKLKPEMEDAVREFQAAEARVVSLQRRMAALHLLIYEGKPESERSLNSNEARAAAEMARISALVVGATSKPADHLRRIFARSKGPLTVKELRQELRHVGCDLAKQANPSGTIGAICARLIEQGVIKPTKKGSLNAWEKIV
jgi:hypothetical protein